MPSQSIPDPPVKEMSLSMAALALFKGLSEITAPIARLEYANKEHIPTSIRDAIRFLKRHDKDVQALIADLEATQCALVGTRP